MTRSGDQSLTPVDQTDCINAKTGKFKFILTLMAATHLNKVYQYSILVNYMSTNQKQMEDLIIFGN